MNHSAMAASHYKILWAKSNPRHALWKHLLDVAAVSIALPPMPDGSILSPEEMAFLVGLHDVGKANPRFQHQDPVLSSELADAGFPVTADAVPRHEQVSAGLVCKFLTGELDSAVSEAICLAIAAHHGYWDQTPYVAIEPYYAAQRQLYEMLRCTLHVTKLPDAAAPDLSAFGMLLTGRVVLCDWLASNERYFTDARLASVDDPAEYLVASKQVALEWVTNLGFDRPLQAGRPGSIVDSPRPLQQTLLDDYIPPGLVIVEAPMGEGKTEAAWILAEKWKDAGYRGMYMALPTMATSDSLHQRYSTDYLARLGSADDVKLIHGMAWIRDAEEPESEPHVGESADDRSLAASWFRPTRRAMLAAHGVGTVDQAMLAGMNTKFGFLRLYGLAGRVLVIDEVHAYDAYMSVIIAGLLKWCACLGIPVVLLSATLSSRQRSMMIEAYGGEEPHASGEKPYPLVTSVTPGAQVREIRTVASSARTLRVSCTDVLGDSRSAAHIAAELIAEGGCCCVVVNTVRQAQEVFQALELPEQEKILFHARYTASDRRERAEKIIRLFGKDTKERPERCVLVATQVVEQSLDVDFDHMVSEIAPIDLLLQRSGRLHRHRPRDHDPVLHVLVPPPGVTDYGGTGRVYMKKPLLRTMAILAYGTGRRALRLPDDLRDLVELCYGSCEWEQDAVPWDVIRRADQEWDIETCRLAAFGRQFTLREPRNRYFCPVGNDPIGDDSDDGTGWRAKTRLGTADTTAVLVDQAELPGLVSGELPMADVRALYQRSLKLPSYLPVSQPVTGFAPGVHAKGRLRGLVLLPVDADGLWRGQDEKGGCWDVRYDKTLGLLVRRAP